MNFEYKNTKFLAYDVAETQPFGSEFRSDGPWKVKSAVKVLTQFKQTRYWYVRKRVEVGELYGYHFSALEALLW